MDARSILARLAEGRLIDELVAALEDVSTQVVATGQPGAVSLELKILPQGDIAIAVKESIRRKPPASKPRGAIFFAHGGGLHREDPRQTRMDLTIVEMKSGPVDPTTGEYVAAQALSVREAH